MTDEERTSIFDALDESRYQLVEALIGCVFAGDLLAARDYAERIRHVDQQGVVVTQMISRGASMREVCDYLGNQPCRPVFPHTKTVWEHLLTPGV